MSSTLKRCTRLVKKLGIQSWKSLTLAIVLAGHLAAPAAEWHVTPMGMAGNAGTQESAWDLESALQGKHGIQPGDTIWISSGTYKHPDRKGGTMGYTVRLAGTAGKPIHVRAMAGQRVTIDGGVTVQPPSTHLWLRDLEILVSENLTLTRRFEEPGSSPPSYNRPWGGLNIYSGEGCKFVNLIIHDNAQGVSWWSGSKDSELHGCIIYDNGWLAPDRGHGHAIYTQNRDGVKTISDCIMTGGHGYTLHAYGSSRADVDNYFVTGNVCYKAGPFLIGGGKPSHNIKVLTNYLSGVSMRLGYSAPQNEDCEIRGNTIVNGDLTISNFRDAAKEDNLVLPAGAAKPGGTKTILNPNRYDPNRANLIAFNWDRLPTVRIHPGTFLAKGDRFRILDPRAFFGQPIVEGKFDGNAIPLRVKEEFGAFILLKN